MTEVNQLYAQGDVPVLTITLGEQFYALLIEDVVEVASMVELVNVIDSRPEFLGIANRHGTPLPILDLRVLLGQPAKPIDTNTLFVVVQHQGNFYGLVVDNVQQVEYVIASEINKSTGSGNYIRGIISNRQRLIQIVALAPILSPYVRDTAADNWSKVET